MTASTTTTPLRWLRAFFAPHAPAGVAGEGGDTGAEEIEHVDLREEGSRIGDWLPYRSYRPDDQIFINRDSLGFLLELTPQSGADQATADRLKGLYARLPAHATMQIMLYASPHVGPVLKRYASLRMSDPDIERRSELLGGRPARNDNVFRQMARRRYAHFMGGSQQPLVPGSGMLVRDFRLFLSVTLPGSIEQLGAIDDLLNIRDGVRSTLESAHFSNRILGADDLISLVSGLLNPARLLGHAPAEAEYQPLKPIGEQCIDRDTLGDWRHPKFSMLEGPRGAEERVEVRCLSLLRPPKRFFLWGMGALIGDLFQDTLQVPCPFIVTMGVTIPDQRDMRTGATMGKAEAKRNADAKHADLLPGAAEKSAEWSAALKALERGGKLVKVYHQIALFAPPGRAQRAESAIRDVWSARGFELHGDTYVNKPALLQALPMTLSRSFAADLEKLRRWDLRTSGNTIHMAPMIAEGKGTGTPTLIGIGRRGQIQALDVFDNLQGGKTAAIVGSVGSGKSTLLQEIATAYASKGALVRVIEMGKSFERTAGRVGGQFVVFSGIEHLCVNPFSLVSETREIQTPEGIEMCGGIDDDVAMLQPLLAKMASPNAPLEPPIYASLAVIIKEEFTLRGRAMTVSHVQQRYRKGKLYDDRPVDQRYYDMADMLAPFSEGGVYANYFEGAATLDFGNSFMVFEMQELDTKPHLKAVVQMILLYQITQEMLEERHRQKIFIMDEAKEALAGSGPDDQAQAQFLEKLYLRVRKYNGSAITATQDVAHYFSSAYGASIWNQSAFILLGRQSENSIEAIAKGDAIKLDDNLRRLLGSIGGGSGHFKEWYVHSDLYRGVMRLVINPSTLLLFSNRAEDNVPLDQRLAEGMSVSDAIDDVLRERGIQEAT